jgi:D-aminopeptidase
VNLVDALVLSGGSAFGLDAATGVVAALREEGRGFRVGAFAVPIVPAAIIFDLANGGDKDWDQSPYPALGHSAFKAAAPEFDLGSCGAGMGARAGMLKGGIGSASLVLPSGATVGALVVVNALGNTVHDGRFWAGAFEMEQEFGGLGVPDLISPEASFRTKRTAPGENTTIAIVATDAVLTKADAQRVAVAAHDGMARAILPAHTPFDGDLVFAVGTGNRPLEGPDALMQIGHAAALCLSRAIARGVFEARPAPGDLVPSFRDLRAGGPHRG